MKSNLIVSILVGILLSLVINRIVYFGFTSNYSINMYSRAKMSTIYSLDVFKYRILSKYLLFGVDDWLSRSMPEKGAMRVLVSARRRNGFCSSLFLSS